MTWAALCFAYVLGGVFFLVAGETVPPPDLVPRVSINASPLYSEYSVEGGLTHCQPFASKDPRTGCIFETRNLMAANLVSPLLGQFNTRDDKKFLEEKQQAAFSIDVSGVFFLRQLTHDKQAFLERQFSETHIQLFKHTRGNFQMALLVSRDNFRNVGVLDAPAFSGCHGLETFRVCQYRSVAMGGAFVHNSSGRLFHVYGADFPEGTPVKKIERAILSALEASAAEGALFVFMGDVGFDPPGQFEEVFRKRGYISIANSGGRLALRDGHFQKETSDVIIVPRWFQFTLRSFNLDKLTPKLSERALSAYGALSLAQKRRLKTLDAGFDGNTREWRSPFVVRLAGRVSFAAFQEAVLGGASCRDYLQAIFQQMGLTVSLSDRWGLERALVSIHPVTLLHFLWNSHDQTPFEKTFVIKDLEKSLNSGEPFRMRLLNLYMSVGKFGWERDLINLWRCSTEKRSLCKVYQRIGIEWCGLPISFMGAPSEAFLVNALTPSVALRVFPTVKMDMPKLPSSARLGTPILQKLQYLYAEGCEYEARHYLADYLSQKKQAPLALFLGNFWGIPPAFIKKHWLLCLDGIGGISPFLKACAVRDAEAGGVRSGPSQRGTRIEKSASRSQSYAQEYRPPVGPTSARPDHKRPPQGR